MKENHQSSLIVRSRFLDISPQKMRPVASLVRRKALSDSLNILQNLPQKGSRILSKILKGAQKQLLKKEENNSNDGYFWINEIKVDQGRIRKKIMMRAKGSADTIRQVNCHLTLSLARRTEK